jgi:hypothetical protein
MAKLQQKKPTHRQKVYFLTAYTLLTIMWLLIGAAVHFSAQLDYSPLILLPFAVLVLGFIVGPRKISAISGRLLLIIGIISIITSLIRGMFDPFSSMTLITVGYIFSGLLIERVSPHVALKSWMYLAIATKLQAIFTSLIVGVSFDGPNDTWWWLVVALMATGIPLLALQQKSLYRLFVVGATVLAFVLLTKVLIHSSAAPLIMLVSVIATLWPIVTMRLVGLKVFTI